MASVTRFGATVDITAVTDVVAFQAVACAESGSPLYGRILDGVVADIAAGQHECGSC